MCGCEEQGWKESLYHNLGDALANQLRLVESEQQHKQSAKNMSPISSQTA